MRELQVDRRAAELGSSRAHGRDQRMSYAATAVILGHAKVTQPQASFAGVRFESAAKQCKADDTFFLFGNKAIEPSVGAEAATEQQGDVGTRIGITDMGRKLPRERRNGGGVVWRGWTYFHRGPFVARLCHSGATTMVACRNMPRCAA